VSITSTIEATRFRLPRTTHRPLLRKSPFRSSQVRGLTLADYPDRIERVRENSPCTAEQYERQAPTNSRKRHRRTSLGCRRSLRPRPCSGMRFRRDTCTRCRCLSTAPDRKPGSSLQLAAIDDSSGRGMRSKRTTEMSRHPRRSRSGQRRHPNSQHHFAVKQRNQSRPPLYFSFAELGTVDNRTAFFVGIGGFGPACCTLPGYVFVRVETPSLIS
jgi:hypothetical protein